MATGECLRGGANDIWLIVCGSSRRQSQGDPGTPTSRGDNAQKLADLERRKNKEIKSLNHEVRILYDSTLLTVG